MDVRETGISPRAEASVKHTPGPWQVHEGGNHVYVGAVGYAEYIERESYLGGPLCVAEVNYKATADHSADHNKAMANARLIAAVPDLLEALKLVWAMFDDERIVRNIANDGKPDWALRMLNFTRDLQTINAAIAKAEGK